MANQTKTISAADRKSYDAIVKGLETKSSMIRALHGAGVSKGDISRYLGIRYQHAYNVLKQPVKKAA